MSIEAAEHSSKADLARDKILALVHSRGAGIKLPTLKEMCEQFKMSRTPVEQAMQSLERQGLIYRKWGSGIFVAEKIGQKNIGVVFGGDIFEEGFSPFWRLLLQAVSRQAVAYDFHLFSYLDITESHGGLGSHLQLMEDISSGRLHGLLLLLPHHAYDEAEQLRTAGLPLVVFGGDRRSWTVTLSSESVICQAAAELAGLGCRRFAFLGNNSSDVLALADGLRKAGISSPEVVDCTYETWAPQIPDIGSRENAAYLIAQKMLKYSGSGMMPDGMLSLDDTMTRGYINALREAGRWPDARMKIASTAHKGSPVLEAYSKDIVTFEIDPGQCVGAALEMLETLMAGRIPAENPVFVKPVLVENGRR